MTEAAVKLVAYADAVAEPELDGQSRILNWLYNQFMAIGNELKARYIATQDSEIGRMLYTERGLRDAYLGSLKDQHPFLKTVHSSPLKNAALRASDSIRRHQASKKGRRNGKQIGWPKFRSWRRGWFSLLYDEPNKGFKLDGNELRLSLGMGMDGKRRSVTLQVPKATKALKNKRVKNLRIVKQRGRFYAVFGVEQAVPAAKSVERAVALDPNHKNLAYGVDTDGNAIEIEAPWWLKTLDRRIDELKAKRDRCNKKSVQVPITDSAGRPTGRYRWRPSRQWQRRDAAYQNALAKRRDQTKTFLATVCHRLCRYYDLVGIGDYAPQGGGLSTGMRRAMTNQSVIARLREQLSWAAVKSGKQSHVYDETGTTRTCVSCHHVVEGGLDPSVREWQCPSCHTHHIRDENAAQNGLIKLLREQQDKGGSVPPVPGSGLVSVKRRWTWRVRPSGIRSRGGRAEAS